MMLLEYFPTEMTAPTLFAVDAGAVSPRATTKPRRGRPPKDINQLVIFHMVKNNAPITVVARHIGIHRDTLYENYFSVIQEAREAWKIIQYEKCRVFLENKRMKEEDKHKKRRYRRGFYYRR